MRYLSLFSGIEAATQAWHLLGWEPVAFAEIEPFPNSVLAHHYPDVPNLGDVTKIDETDIAMLGHIDLVVFGSPCQDLSVAGKRKGLAGERSGLFHTAIDITEWAREHCGLRWALWENVPGAFSSNKGRDFAAVVGQLAGLPQVDVPPKGWGTEGCALGEKGMVEWAVLDAQWFGVAQRRRRVFALVDFGDWAGRQPILLEPESLRGDSAPRRETGQGTAHSAAFSAGNSGDSRSIGYTEEGTPPLRAGTSGTNQVPTVLRGLGVASTGEVAHCLNAGGMKRIDYESETLVAHSLRADGFNASEDGTGRGTPLVPVGFNARQDPDAWSERSGPLDTNSSTQAVAYGWSEELTAHCELAGTLQYGGQGGRHDGVMQPDMQVRRLTPKECERLQGFKDNYTVVLHKGKPAADGPRYKALGNSMAVTVMRWIGQQIDFVRLFQ